MTKSIKFSIMLTLILALALCFVITSSATIYSTYDYDDLSYNVFTGPVTTVFGKIIPGNVNIFYRSGVYFSNAPTNYYTFEFLYVERFISWLQDNNLTDYDDFIAYVENNENGNEFRNLKYMTAGQFDYIFNFPYTSSLFDEGLQQGYLQGYDEGEIFGYNNGLTEGYNNGLTEGYNDGYSVGRGEGYNEGYNVGMTDADAVERGFMTVLSSPMYVLGNVLNFEIFGINLFTIVTSILSIIIVAWVIKKLAN